MSIDLETRPASLSVPSIAPPAQRFAAYPASWYLFCDARRLRRGPYSKDILGRRLVAYRTESGDVVVLDARCSHLGADLGRGRVRGESIQCPFHNWEFGPDGRCSRIPAGDEPPAFARQVCYPAVERHGQVFFFNGRQPLFPLPFFFDEQPENFLPGRPYSFVGNCTWYMLAAHAFDTQHFEAVHDRKLTGPPLIDTPAPFARRNRYTAEVVGSTIYDRILRHSAGRMVDISITVWGGTMVWITGTFQRAHSYFLIATQPIDNGQVLCENIVFARRSQSRMVRQLLTPLSLEIRRIFTRAYQIDEVSRLGNPRYNPNSLIAGDQDMIDYFHWAAALK